MMKPPLRVDFLILLSYVKKVIGLHEQAQFLYDTTQHMMKRTGNTRNPEEIAVALGAELLDDYDLKGMYSSAGRHRSIFIHCYLSRRVRRFVVAHKLGHDQLHRLLAREKPLQELHFFPARPSTQQKWKPIL
ncbi:TPA: hypothetical protein QFD20_002411 [Enterococcus faecium]